MLNRKDFIYMFSVGVLANYRVYLSINGEEREELAVAEEEQKRHLREVKEKKRFIVCECIV